MHLLTLGIDDPSWEVPELGTYDEFFSFLAAYGMSGMCFRTIGSLLTTLFYTEHPLVRAVRLVHEDSKDVAVDTDDAELITSHP